MRRFQLLKLVFFIVCLNVIASGQIKNVKFVVIADGLDDTACVYITGNNQALGDWDPSKVALKRSHGGSWEITLSFEKGTSLEYKFTLGSWSSEALADNGSAPGNSLLRVESDTTVTVTIKQWGKFKRTDFKGQVTGTVKYHRSFEGEEILPRDIAVWLPQSYYVDSVKSYPVLYAHDGQNMFDPLTSAFGIDWQIDETSDSLMKQNKIEEYIVVGIYNSPQRGQEYLPGGKSSAYQNFIVKQLKPFIDSTYRTLSDKNNTATIGSSAGGTISMMLLWEHNDVFGKAACISPAFKIRELDYVKNILNDSAPWKELKVYIDIGGVGIDSLLIPGVNDMKVALEEKGYTEGKDFIFYFDKGAEHNEPAWAKRLWRPLLFLFPHKK